VKTPKIRMPRGFLTYRQGLNRGYIPVNYHTKHGVYACWVVKEGRKWMTIQWSSGLKKRVLLSEKCHMRQFKSKAG